MDHSALGYVSPPAPKQHAKITVELITDALRDYYHNGMADTGIRRKYHISKTEWDEIKQAHGDKFVARFGKSERKQISEVNIEDHWKTVDIPTPQPDIYKPRAPRAADAAAPANAPAAKKPAANRRF